jgi:hypothetical protein
MSTAQIIYAALFRLAIIDAGFGCVVTGYRLFVLGVMPKVPHKNSEHEYSEIEIGVKIGEINLSMKNAAPGT